MGVFTFVLRSSGGQWNAKQYEGDIEASASSTFDLQRLLVKAALAVDSSGGVQSSYSPVSPSSAVFQVIVGGAVFVGGGGGGAAAAPAGGSAPAAEAPAPEKKEEKVEEEDDEDMGFSLFD